MTTRSCKRLLGRLVVGGGLMIGTCGAVVALMAPPAGATVNRNSIGCSGQAVITKTNGQTLTINASQSEAHVPRKAGRVQYSGSVTTVTHNQHGYVAVVVGPWKVNFYTWGGKNNSNKTTDTGSRAYPSVLKDVPPGKYKVSGGHFATEGSCTGSMTIVIDGGPLSNPVGLGALIGTIVFALILLTSLFGHPIVGGFGGLLLAPFVIADLMLFKVSPPTSLIVFGAPIVAILIGIGLGLWGPLSRGASPPN